MQIACPAKVNLTLEVLDRRDDGYHALRSVMVPLALADTLTIDPAEEFTFLCNLHELQSEENLVVRAVRALDVRARVAVTLEKRIPTHAGLGGGSSDAAGVLLAGMAGALPFGEPLDWLAAARALGSDVPFFLAQSAALVEGTGERVTAAGALPPWHVLVVKPPAAVSTSAAYGWIDEHPRPSRPRNESTSLAALTALQRGDFEAVQALLSNDFQAPVARRTPPVAYALEALRRAGSTRPLLSGSGSAVFALAPDRAGLAEIERRLDLDASYLRYPTELAHSAAWRGVVA
jgi:4-diphosphocytidyl-2-C-methyl-D-erythritol kinase